MADLMLGKTSDSASSASPKLAQLQAQLAQANAQAALAQANMVLTREKLAQSNHANMLAAREHMFMQAMQDNARLAHENMMLKKMTQGPPGLEAEVSTCAGSSLGGSWAGSSNPSSWTGSTASSPPGSFQLDNCAEADSQAPEEPELPPGSSVMMRNLPNDYTRSSLLELLRTEDFEGKYDFVYLPIDFRSSSGLGYAFINFLSLEIAERFRSHFGGFNRWSVKSDKVCEVTWSSLQGLEAHIERFRNSPVMHESIPDDQKPALFEGTERVVFPEPTRKIREPRHWHRRR